MLILIGTHCRHPSCSEYGGSQRSEGVWMVLKAAGAGCVLLLPVLLSPPLGNHLEPPATADCACWSQVAQGLEMLFTIQSLSPLLLAPSLSPSMDSHPPRPPAPHLTLLMPSPPGHPTSPCQFLTPPGRVGSLQVNRGGFAASEKAGLLLSKRTSSTLHPEALSLAALYLTPPLKP